jgi:hypothetical protein
LSWLYPEHERRLGFVVCFGYIQSLNKEWFCCLLWLYPESEQKVGFVVCCGYIQNLNEEWVLLFVVVISRA